jgi:uracil phosphoribosyltransferase
VFGNRDHTTVLYAVTKIRDRSQNDRLFRNMLDDLGTRLMNRPAGK